MPLVLDIEKPLQTVRLRSFIRLRTLCRAQSFAGVEALSELRAAVPSLQAIAGRAFTLAAATEFEGPRRYIERVGIRAADLIAAISGLAQW